MTVPTSYRLALGLLLVGVHACGPVPEQVPPTATAELSRPTPVQQQADATRGIFHLHRPCAGRVTVRRPYAVLDDGWGGWEVRARSEALDDQQVEIPTGDLDPQNSFGFSNAPYRGDGVRAWIKARTVGNLRGTAKLASPGHKLPTGFKSWATMQIADGGTRPTGYSYLSPDGLVAMQCSPPPGDGELDLPNPTCEADVQDKAGRFLFRASFPIRLSHRLDEIVTAGHKLFGPAVDACPIHK